jgi:hypothetical protein
MENNKLARQLGKSLQITSLKDLVRAKTSETAMLVLDCSGSMWDVMRNGKTRIQGLREVVAQVQASRPTTLIAFGPPKFNSEDPSGLHSRPAVAYFVTEVPDPGGLTPLAEAIDFAREQGAGKIVVVSDGQPNDSQRAMESARRFGGIIDVCFVGDDGDLGAMFLDQLAKVTGGSKFNGDLGETKLIGGKIVGLLGGAVFEEVDEDDDDEDDDDEDDE